MGCKISARTTILPARTPAIRDAMGIPKIREKNLSIKGCLPGEEQESQEKVKKRKTIGAGVKKKSVGSHKKKVEERASDPLQEM